MADPTTTNSAATSANTAIVDVVSALIPAAEGLIIADVPALGLPIIKQIWEALFSWIAGYFEKAAENGATFGIIDLQVIKEEAGVSAGIAALIAAEKTGDPNAIQQAIKDYADANSALVHDDGSAPAQ